MPFPNPATQFGKGIDPSIAGKKGMKVTGERYGWFNMRRYCRPDCKIFNTCPYSGLSHTKYDGKCALKEMPKKIQNRTIKALSNNPDDYIEMIAENLVELATRIDLENNNEMRLKYIDRLLKFHEIAYGKKQIIHANVTSITPQQIMEEIDKIIAEEKKRSSINNGMGISDRMDESEEIDGKEKFNEGSDEFVDIDKNKKDNEEGDKTD